MSENKMEFYSVPPLEPEVIQAANEIILGVSEIIGDGNGLIGDEILAKSLAIRVRNSAACVIRLLNLGFIHESYILLRSVSEATILFHEAMNKTGFKDTYQLEEFERIFQLLKKQKLIDDGTDKDKAKELEKKIAEVKEKMEQARDTRYKLRTLAEKNGCEHEFAHYHGLGSAYVHCLPNVMTDYFTLLPGNVIEWDNTPNLEDRNLVASGALQCLGKIGIKWAEVRGDEGARAKAKETYAKLIKIF